MAKRQKGTVLQDAPIKLTVNDVWPVLRSYPQSVATVVNPYKADMAAVLFHSTVSNEFTVIYLSQVAC